MNVLRKYIGRDKGGQKLKEKVDVLLLCLLSFIAMVREIKYSSSREQKD